VLSPLQFRDAIAEPREFLDRLGALTAADLPRDAARKAKHAADAWSADELARMRSVSAAAHGLAVWVQAAAQLGTTAGALQPALDEIAAQEAASAQGEGKGMGE